MEIAILALGCFWGPEIKFSKLEGIVKTEVGYCGGQAGNFDPCRVYYLSTRPRCR